LIDHFLDNGAKASRAAAQPALGPESAASRIVEIIENSRK
jgi:hypothetical protein